MRVDSDTPRTALAKKATAYLRLFCLGLSLLTAAISFGRKYPVRYAASRQSQAWEVIHSAGQAYQSDDINLAWYAKAAYDAFSDGIDGVDDGALLGVLLRSVLAAALPLTFKDWWEIPTDIPEILFFTAALACIQKERLWILPFVTAAAASNRETAPSVKALRQRVPWIRWGGRWCSSANTLGPACR